MTTRVVTIPPSITPFHVPSPGLCVTQGGGLSILDARDGEILWRVTVGGLVFAAVGDERLFLCVNGVGGCSIQALELQGGSLLWSYPVDGYLSGAPVVRDGYLYASLGAGEVLALHADRGTLLWSSRVGPILTSPPVLAGRSAYVSPRVHPPAAPAIFALDARDGVPLWPALALDDPAHALVATADRLYVADALGCRALDADGGSLLWRYSYPQSAQYSSLAVGGETLFLSYTAGELLGLDQQGAYICAIQAASGVPAWRQNIIAGTRILSAPAPAVEDDAVYVGADDGYMYALRASDGADRWRRSLSAAGGAGARAMCSAPVASGGAVYVGADDGYVYALRASDGADRWRTFVGAPAQARLGSAVG